MKHLDMSQLGSADRQALALLNADLQPFIGKCIHELFEESYQARPDAQAISSWDGDLTYSELRRYTLRLSQVLLRTGLRTGDVVPICMDKSFLAVVAMLAIMFAGGTCLAIDPKHPDGRSLPILSDVEAPILLATPVYAKRFARHVQTVLGVECDLLDEASDETATIPLPIVSPKAGAFINFTSGSTGHPKGVVLSHDAISTSVKAQGKAACVDQNSRVLQFASFTFDVSIYDIFVTLGCGGCVCIPSEDHRQGDITNFMRDKDVNWAFLTPSFSQSIHPAEVPCLKTLVLGGESMTAKDVHKWEPHVRLLNGYGSTEAGTCVIGEISPGSRHGLLGRSVGAACWVIRDDTLARTGEVGELYVAGPSIAEGYFKDAVRTESAFIGMPCPGVTEGHCYVQTNTHSAGNARSQRMYRTGDLVYYDQDGMLHFVGRQDNRVKLHGQRVELGELEHHISKYSELIDKSIVCLVKEGCYRGQLVAVIQLSTGTLPPVQNNDFCTIDESHLSNINFDISGLSFYVGSRVPSYMIPSSWLVFEKIPLTGSAKVDRSKIQEWLSQQIYHPHHVKENIDATSEAPRSNADRIAIQLLHQLVEFLPEQFPSAVIELPLTAFGLNSIKRITLLRFIKTQFHVNMGTQLLSKETLTVRQLADKIDGSTGTGPQSTAVDVMTRFKDLARLVSFPQNSPEMIPVRERPDHQTILLTGATGYLGTQILRRLLDHPQQFSVIALVRPDGRETPIDKVARTATQAAWWSKEFRDKLEIWPGDLERPRLGLEGKHYSRLGGSKDAEVDAIIHAGAVVDWHSDFKSLEMANVHSTLELLHAATTSVRHPRVVFVGGGRFWSARDEDLEVVASQMAGSNGYFQTKFVSELLVHDFAVKSPRGHPITCIVHPGYIIGTPEEGVISADDILWRLVVAVVDVRSYSRQHGRKWNYVASAARVAADTIDCLQLQGTEKQCVIRKIVDGMPFEDFWAILGECLGVKLEAVEHDVWMESIRRRMDEQGEKHPLWPVFDQFESESDLLGGDHPPVQPLEDSVESLRAAIKRSVQSLQAAEIGRDHPWNESWIG